MNEVCIALHGLNKCYVIKSLTIFIKLMLQNSLEQSNHIDIPTDSISSEFQLNTLELNASHYNDAIEGSEYGALVTDLDGVVLERGNVRTDVLDAIKRKIFYRQFDSGIPFVIATGRSYEDVDKLLLHDLLVELSAIGISFKRGEFLVFTNNGAQGKDIVSGEIIFSKQIDPEVLEEALKLDEIKILLEIRDIELALRQDRSIIRKRSIVNNGFTYTFGINIPQLDILLESEKGHSIISKFELIFGKTRSLFYVAQLINQHLRTKGLAVTVTTTGSTIDINASGVDKAVSIKYLSKTIGIDDEKILSIGDSVFGNDQELTQRKGGFVNIPTILPGNVYPIYIDEDGNQFERVAKMINKVNFR